RPRTASAPSSCRIPGKEGSRRDGRAPRSATRSSCRRTRRSASAAGYPTASSASSRTASGTLYVPGIRKELEPKMETFHSIAELRHALAPLREGRRVGLVPTMGALHEGHAALFSTARSDCDLVVASLFVNPTQFSDPADLAAY